MKNYNNFGAARQLDENLFELKFKNIGGGIRIYYGLEDHSVVLLLGGNKGSQKFDIAKARKFWNEHLNSDKEQENGTKI